MSVLPLCVLQVDVWRLGSLAGYVSVSYTTDASILYANVLFKPIEGRIEFAPGVDVQTIELPILVQGKFAPTVQIGMTLSLMNALSTVVVPASRSAGCFAFG